MPVRVRVRRQTRAVADQVAFLAGAQVQAEARAGIAKRFSTRPFRKSIRSALAGMAALPVRRPGAMAQPE